MLPDRTRCTSATFTLLTEPWASAHLVRVAIPTTGEEADNMNAPVLAYQFASPEPDMFAELQRVVLTAPTTTDDGVEVPVGTSGTIVGVWPKGAAYEVDFSLGLATVEASKLALA